MADEFWEKNADIAPRPVAQDDIWRGANQMIKRYGGKAATEAAARSDAASKAGDEFNQKLWFQVMACVQELQRRADLGPSGTN